MILVALPHHSALGTNCHLFLTCHLASYQSPWQLIERKIEAVSEVIRFPAIMHDDQVIEMSTPFKQCSEEFLATSLKLDNVYGYNQ